MKQSERRAYLIRTLLNEQPRYAQEIEQLRREIAAADAIVIGAGAGLSTSAGLTYSGERFMKYFADFHEKYGINDIYSGGFYPFETLEEYSFISRLIKAVSMATEKSRSKNNGCSGR